MWTPIGFHSGNAGLNILYGALTRDFTISGTTQFSSGPYSTFNFSGLDANGDGSTANDRPLVGNARQPIGTVGIDGTYVKGTPGVYYDLVANNQTNALNVVTPNQVHFLIPYSGQYTGRGVGRNSFENPGQQFWNVAAQKGIPLGKVTRLESSQLVLRAEGQNVGNHNNVKPLDINLLDVGTPQFTNKSNRRENTYQNFRLWAKFVF